MCQKKSKWNLLTNAGAKIFEKVEFFMYLSMLIDNKCVEEKKIELTVAKANNCTGSLMRIVKNKEISKQTISMYSTYTLRQP